MGTDIELEYINCEYITDENYYYSSIFLEFYIKVYSKDYVFEVGIQYTDNDWDSIKIEKAKHVYTYNDTSDINIWKVRFSLLSDTSCWPNINIEYVIYAKIHKNTDSYIVWNNNLNKNFIIPLNKLEKYTFQTNHIIIDDIIFNLKNMDELDDN